MFVADLATASCRCPFGDGVAAVTKHEGVACGSIPAQINPKAGLQGLMVITTLVYRRPALGFLAQSLSTDSAVLAKLELVELHSVH